jgi:hypothetical protein
MQMHPFCIPHLHKPRRKIMKFLVMFLIALGMLAALTIYAGAQSSGPSSMFFGGSRGDASWSIARGNSSSFYDGQGRFAGSSVTRGNSSSFHDGQGRFSGSAIGHGNSTSFYDGRGRYTGSSINSGPRR